MPACLPACVHAQEEWPEDAAVVAQIEMDFDTAEPTIGDRWEGGHCVLLMYAKMLRDSWNTLLCQGGACMHAGPLRTLLAMMGAGGLVLNWP